jgi:DNA-binding winged helix-turn-helix (wHTH) protein
MTVTRSKVFHEFGPFRMEPGERRPLRDGQPVPLTAKVFDTLCVLIDHHGTLVSKQELMNAVWPEITVEENNLDRNISALRKVLGHGAIETVPRVGYRFVLGVNDPTSPNGDDQHLKKQRRQEIRFCVTADKVRIAYSTGE